MKKIFKLWLANELINKGFGVIKYEINSDNPKLKVFIFEDTKEFNDAINEIMKKRFKEE